MGCFEEHICTRVLNACYCCFLFTGSKSTDRRQRKPTCIYLDELLKRYDVIFKQQLGKIKDLKATIRVQSEATPKFFKPRPVAYALRERVEQELGRLVAIGVIEPISHSEWAAPIVPVIKGM